MLICALPRTAMAVKAQPLNAKAFILTTSYGVVAGSLIGAASLALYSTPGDHLRNIAIGASSGLYMGILIGFYLLYGHSSDVPEKGKGAPSVSPVTPNPGPPPGQDDNPIDLGLHEGWHLAPTIIVDQQGRTGPGLGMEYRF